MSYDIRAMSFAEIMDAGFQIVRRHFALILGIAAALYVPVAILGALLMPFAMLPGANPVAGIGAGRLGAVIGLGLYMIIVSPICRTGSMELTTWLIATLFTSTRSFRTGWSMTSWCSCTILCTRTPPSSCFSGCTCNSSPITGTTSSSRSGLSGAVPS